ncbi:MAG TPA: hypothetical protein VIK10_04425 [Prolixibacteraceae bacterium]
MKKILLLAVVGVLTQFISACDNNEVKEFSKEGAIETVLAVDHLDAKRDIITTTHNVWINNLLAKKIVRKDTIPALGMTSQTAENNEGETKNVTLAKEYEIYITVK